MKSDIRQSVDRLLQLTEALCDTGYAYALHIRFTRPDILYRTYPQSWIETYDREGMSVDDPAVVWGLARTGVIRWEDLKEDGRGIMATAKAHGLTNGVSCAVGPSLSRSIAGFTRSGRAFSDSEVQQLYALTRQMHRLTETAAI